jgi:hypothetical protein
LHYFNKSLSTILAVIALAAIAALPTMADTLNLGITGWNAEATFKTTPSTATTGIWWLTLSFVNATGKTTDLNSFAIQLFNAGASESFTVSSASLNNTAFSVVTAGTGFDGNWEYFADDKLNNGSTPDCNTQTAKGWLCADSYYGPGFHGTIIHPLQVSTGTSAVFTFSGTYSGTSGIKTLDLMASGCLVAGTCKLDGGKKDTNKWAVSSPMIAVTPEPASLSLLAAGLLAMCGLTRRPTAYPDKRKVQQ